MGLIVHHCLAWTSQHRSLGLHFLFLSVPKSQSFEAHYAANAFQKSDFATLNPAGPAWYALVPSTGSAQLPIKDKLFLTLHE